MLKRTSFASTKEKDILEDFDCTVSAIKIFQELKANC